MLITPRTTEKSYAMAGNNVYVFDVPLNASKAEVIAEIEKQYEGVKIKDVRMLITKGKVKAVNRGKRSRPGKASRKDAKKAYVTVLEGKIEIAAFNEIENQAKADAEKSDVSASETKQSSTAASEKTKATEKTSVKKVIAGEKVKKASGLGLFAKKRSGRRGDK
jgi:ribosomal protein L23